METTLIITHYYVKEITDFANALLKEEALNKLVSIDVWMKNSRTFGLKFGQELTPEEKDKISYLFEQNKLELSRTTALVEFTPIENFDPRSIMHFIEKVERYSPKQKPWWQFWGK